MKLTKRQDVLIIRLEEIGRRVENEVLPVEVERIVGFGSLFRGKPNPEDADLVLIASTPRPLYEIFRTIMLKAIEKFESTKNHYKAKETWPTPLDAFKSMIQGVDPKTLVSVLSQKDIEVMYSWLRDFSWNMLESMTMFFPPSSEKVTIRCLQFGLPGVKISRLVGSEDDLKTMTAKKYYTIWTEDNHDVRGSIVKILSSPDMLNQGRLTELENFENQLAPFKLQMRVLPKVIWYLLKMDKDSLQSEQAKSREAFVAFLLGRIIDESMFPDLNRRQIELAINENFDGFTRPEKKVLYEVTPIFDGSSYQSLPSAELGTLTEKRRKELAAIRGEIKYIRNLLHYSMDWHISIGTRPVEYWGDIKVYTVTKAIYDTPQYIIDTPSLKQLLRRLGLLDAEMQEKLKEHMRGERRKWNEEE